MQRIISEIADIVRELSWSREPYFQLFIIPVWQKWVRLNGICAVFLSFFFFFSQDGAIIAEECEECEECGECGEGGKRL